MAFNPNTSPFLTAYAYNEAEFGMQASVPLLAAGGLILQYSGTGGSLVVTTSGALGNLSTVTQTGVICNNAESNIMYARQITSPETTITVTNADGADGDIQLDVIPNTTVQRVQNIYNSAEHTITSTRPSINWIPGANINITLADNDFLDAVDVTIEATGGSGGAWEIVSAGTSAVDITPNTSYVPMHLSTPVTFTLPVSMEPGATFRIAGFGSGGWIIAQNADQQIFFGNESTTEGTGGSLASTNAKDCVEIVCTIQDTSFLVISSMGNITIV